MKSRFPSLAALVIVFGGWSSVAAQSSDSPVVRPEIHNVTRVELWSFFDPPPGGGDPDYTLVSNRARLAVHVEGRRLAFDGSFQYAQLLGLPRSAVGPGPLGPGALYFAAAGTPEAYQLYFKTMSLTVKNVLPRLSFSIGRMPYHSDEESTHPGRLIGNAEWTPFERSFDGIRADYQRQQWRLQAAFVMPTQGAFEESASPTIGKLQIATTELNSRWGQLFAHRYRDTRAVSGRPDNTGRFADAVDVNVQTFGGSSSRFGVNVWAAVQRGQWYGDRHRAFSVIADTGREFSTVTWRPSVRAGILYASGDADPNDSRHGTFFPMLPTTRPDLLRGTYAQMNLRDINASIGVEPRERFRLTAGVHVLSLAHRQDRWYSGTGATAFSGDYFGFSSRRSTLRSGLGTFLQLTAAARVNEYWTLSASTGVLRGGDVVRRQFDGRTMFVTAFESVVLLR